MEVICAYSRANAIEDGVLVDVSGMAKEVGFKIPVAVTRSVWMDCVVWTEEDTKAPQDQEGRLWDVVYMAYYAASNACDSQMINVELYRVPRDGKEVKALLVELKMIVSGGDNGEPVITISQPHED